MTNKLNDSELDNIVGAGDTDSIKFQGKPVPLPEAKSGKQPCDLKDGDYTKCQYYNTSINTKQECINKQLCRNEKCPIRQTSI